MCVCVCVCVCVSYGSFFFLCCRASSRLDWMYQGAAARAAAASQDYLLGKAFDETKLVSKSDVIEASGSGPAVPGSLFVSDSSGPVDVMAKVREDPMFLIKKREKESLQSILDNPMKMREIGKV